MTSNSLDFLLNLQANTSGFDQGINGAKAAVNALVGAMAALGVGLGVKELAEAADSYATLSAKIQQSTKESGNFEQAMSGVHQIALQTNSTLDNTGALFTRLNTVAKDMGKSQQFALDMTSTVTKAIQLGGSSTQEAEAAVTQFIQAMQGGVLRGEEFNSIMEGGYGLAEALAKGLGKTTGELRAMAENGELSAERVLAALEKQKAGVDAQYAEMPTTISNALQKIATSWQILIGEMDQANGASATAAQWLSVLADNLNIVEALLNDIGNGFVWFGDQLKKIDPQTIEALKAALLSAYDAVKSLGSSIGTAFETTTDILNTTLGQIFNFNSGIDSATDKTNGFTKALQAVNVVFGFISDGFKALNIGINLIIGAAYDAAGAFSYWKSKITFGDTSAQAVKDFEVMSAKAQEYYKKSSDAAIEFKSAGVEAIRQIGLTQDEKNAERVANNEKTLSDLKAQEAQHVTDYKAISDERIKLQQQLVDARKSGDQSAIDAAVAGLAELDKKEKAYQAESKKISDEKIKAAQDWASAQIEAATKGGVALSSQTKKTIEAQIAAQGLAVEFDKTGKAIVKAIAVDAGAAVVSLETRLGQGRKAAAALGLDLDVALNRVSEGFAGKQTNLEDFTKSLELMGVKGQDAANVTYEAWLKWLETAKSQAEIDAAKVKFKEFEEQGVFSAKQVENGMLALEIQTSKVKGETDETTEAFKRLGIQTKEQLSLAAKQAMMDFEKVKNSGQATAEGTKQAYEKMSQAVALSGDQAMIAQAKAVGASNGLNMEIDKTGKAVVKTTQEIVDALYPIGSAAESATGRAAQGFRELGRVAREEAKTSLQEWEDAMAKIDKQRKAQAAETAKGLGQMADGQAQMAQDFYNQLIAGGMEQGRAEALKKEAMTRMNNQFRDALNGGTAQSRIDAMTGRNASKDWMDNILKLQSKSGSMSASAPKTQSTPNIQPPETSQIKMPNIDVEPKSLATYKFEFGGKQFELQGDSSQQNVIDEFFREMEQAKKRW